MALAQEGSPASFAGAFQVAQSIWLDEPKVAAAFNSGEGLGWHQHSTCLFKERNFFRPGYDVNLISSWIPHSTASRSNESRRGRGRCRLRPRRVYDFDGRGLSQIAFLRLRLPRAVHQAREGGGKRGGCRQTHHVPEGVGEGFPRAEIRRGDDVRLPARHGRSRRRGQAREEDARQSPAPGRSSNPFANDDLKRTTSIRSVRIFYAASTMICTPALLAQEVGLGLGAQAGESVSAKWLRKPDLSISAAPRKRRSTSSSRLGCRLTVEKTHHRGGETKEGFSFLFNASVAEFLLRGFPRGCTNPRVFDDAGCPRQRAILPQIACTKCTASQDIRAMMHAAYLRWEMVRWAAC